MLLCGRYGVAGDHVVGIVAVAGFDGLMSADQIHAGGRRSMVANQRVLSDGRFDLVLGFWFRRVLDFLPIVDAAFHEDRQNCGAQYPVTPVGDGIEPRAVGATGRKQNDLLEIFGAETQAFHHDQEQFWMRLAEGESAGVFLVNIVGQHAANRSRRILSVDASQEHGEVSYVHSVFLLKMNFELVFREGAVGELRPDPVMLAIHETEDLLPKLWSRQWLHHSFLLSFPHGR